MLWIALPGDYNQNGIVDAADYLVGRKNVGTSGALPNDLIGGAIGTAKYNQWRINFGQTSSEFGSGASATANAAVPNRPLQCYLCLRRLDYASGDAGPHRKTHKLINA